MNYTADEQTAARIIASLIYPDFPGGPDLETHVNGLYGPAVNTCRDPYEMAAITMPQDGILRDCHGDAATAWEGLRQMSGAATPYAQLDPLIRAIGGTLIPQRPIPTSDHASDQSAIDTPARFAIAREDALMELPPVRYLDRELGLVAKSFHLIYGASGSGKTFFAIERAMRQVAQGRRALYIPTEDVQGLRYRIVAWRRAHPNVSGHLTWLQMPTGLDLQDHDQVAELIETIDPYHYDHIVIDTLREAHSGDENSSQDTRRINRAIQRLVCTGAAVDVVHHTGVAGERPRGSTALFGNADAVIKVEDDDGYVRVSFEKLRNAPPRDALAFGMVQQDTGLTDTDGEPVISVILRSADQTTRRDTKLSPIQRDVLRTLALSIFDGIGAKAQQVIDTSGITRRNVYLALASLKTRGFVSQGSKGDPYTITSNGRSVLNDPQKSQSSDQGFSPSIRASDRSDQQVIRSDQHPTGNEVITSDHTRRVITRSHTRTSDIDHKSSDDLFSHQAPDGLTAEQWEQAQYLWGVGRYTQFADVARAANMAYTDLKRLVERVMSNA